MSTETHPQSLSKIIQQHLSAATSPDPYFDMWDRVDTPTQLAFLASETLLPTHQFKNGESLVQVCLRQAWELKKFSTEKTLPYPEGIQQKEPDLVSRLYVAALLVQHGANPFWNEDGTHPDFLDAILLNGEEKALHALTERDDFPSPENLNRRYSVKKFTEDERISWAHQFIQNNQKGLLDLWVRAGGELGVDQKGQSGLFFAESAEMVQHLVKKGVSINAVDHEGNTALFNVANSETAQALGEAGIDLEIRNKDGKTAFDFWENDRPKLVQAMVEKGMTESWRLALNKAADFDFSKAHELVESQPFPWADYPSRTIGMVGWLALSWINQEMGDYNSQPLASIIDGLEAWASSLSLEALQHESLKGVPDGALLIECLNLQFHYKLRKFGEVRGATERIENIQRNIKESMAKSTCAMTPENRLKWAGRLMAHMERKVRTPDDNRNLQAIRTVLWHERLRKEGKPKKGFSVIRKSIPDDEQNVFDACKGEAILEAIDEFQRHEKTILGMANHISMKMLNALKDIDALEGGDNPQEKESEKKSKLKTGNQLLRMAALTTRKLTKQMGSRNETQEPDCWIDVIHILLEKRWILLGDSPKTQAMFLSIEDYGKASKNKRFIEKLQEVKILAQSQSLEHLLSTVPDKPLSRHRM